MCKPFYNYRLAKIDTSRFVKKKRRFYLFIYNFLLSGDIFIWTVCNYIKLLTTIKAKLTSNV